ncbi:MAG: hypothetical protein J0M11_13200 [Anaerolineae bacterium]|nr:hypothetical protein [Anaerolineae bacterium]
MLTILYIVFVAAFAYLTWQSVGVYQSKRSSYALLLLIVLAGLAYDVLIIMLGRFIGEGDLLKTLNAGRYVVHGFATPIMIIFGFGVLKHAGVKWAQSRTTHIVVCVVTTLLIALGVYEDVLALDLQSKTVMDILRYTNEGGIKGPPIPAMLTIVFLIVAGISLWRNTGWWWLAACAIFMFIAAGAGMGDMFYIGNLGEVVLGLGNVLTAKKFLS